MLLVKSFSHQCLRDILKYSYHQNTKISTTTFVLGLKCCFLTLTVERKNLF